MRLPVLYATLILHLRSFLFYSGRSANNSCEISKIKKVVRLGVKDQGLQEYLRDNERFADLVNGTLFAGKQIIKASYLKEVQRKKRVSCQLQTIGSNTHKIKSSDENGVKFIYLERERDFLRLHDKPGCRVLLACEAESRANYEMPVRCFTYDGVEYTDQLKSRKRNRKRGKHRKRRPLVPVFHQVLYLGETRWQSKKKLQEMMESWR